MLKQTVHGWLKMGNRWSAGRESAGLQAAKTQRPKIRALNFILVSGCACTEWECSVPRVPSCEPEQPAAMRPQGTPKGCQKCPATADCSALCLHWGQSLGSNSRDFCVLWTSAWMGREFLASEEMYQASLLLSLEAVKLWW